MLFCIVLKFGNHQENLHAKDMICNEIKKSCMSERCHNANDGFALVNRVFFFNLLCFGLNYFPFLSVRTLRVAYYHFHLKKLSRYITRKY